MLGGALGVLQPVFDAYPKLNVNTLPIDDSQFYDRIYRAKSTVRSILAIHPAAMVGLRSARVLRMSPFNGSMATGRKLIKKRTVPRQHLD